MSRQKDKKHKKTKKRKWQKDKIVKKQNDKRIKWPKEKKTKWQKDKEQKESLILWRQGSFALLRCFFLHLILHNFDPTWYDDMSGTDCPSKVRSGAVRLILNPSWVQVPNLSEQFCSSKGNQVMSILQVDLKIPGLKMFLTKSPHWWTFSRSRCTRFSDAIRPGLSWKLYGLM